MFLFFKNAPVLLRNRNTNPPTLIPIATYTQRKGVSTMQTIIKKMEDYQKARQKVLLAENGN